LISITDINVYIPSLREPLPRRSIDPLLLLLQLDAAVRPGITEAQFRSLFTRCTCGLIMTKCSFGAHRCENEDAETDVIEITDEDSS